MAGEKRPTGKGRVPDPASAAFPAEAAQFAAVPAARLRFPALMLASTDDPYASLDYAKYRATEWGCDLAVLGSLGHINGASGLGKWQQGRSRLDQFVAELA